jgi:transposase-like protein
MSIQLIPSNIRGYYVVTTKTVIVRCPQCGSDKVTKNGRNKTGKQVYSCNNAECQRTSFVGEYSYKGFDPEVRRKVLDMSVNGNGTRAIARTLKISKDTVTAILKKKKIGFGK